MKVAVAEKKRAGRGTAVLSGGNVSEGSGLKWRIVRDGGVRKAFRVN